MESPRALQEVSPEAGSYLLCRADLCAGGGVVAHNPPVLQLNNAAPVRGISLRVRDLDDSCTAVIQPFEELHNLFALRGVKISRRLIRQN